jgi:hypothetical protein
MSALATRTAYTNALRELEDDLERARADLLAAVDDIIVDVDAEDDILVEGDDGVTGVDAQALRDLLDSFADAPQAVTGAFEDYDWQVQRALRALKQALVREAAS